MDFTLPPEVLRFRDEVRAFVKAEWPENLSIERTTDREDAHELQHQFRKKLAAKGWLALAWPKEYGGAERSPLEQYVFAQEMAYHGAPSVGAGGGMVGPIIIRYGTDDQKTRFLPKIAAGDLELCLGYSEPDAGSDLASLQTRAVEDGDWFVVNGIKRWTSGAHRAEYMWLAARTDPTAPKHRGISMFLLDMHSPGITIRPIHTMSGYRTNEVYMENVRVPRANLIGELNRGWYYAAGALDMERVVAFPVGGFRAMFDRLVQAVKDAEYDGCRLKDDPLVRQKLAQISVELEATQVLSYRAAWLVSQSIIPNYEASMLKLMSTESRQRMSHVATEIFGLYGQLGAGSPDVPLEGDLEWEYLHNVMPTFGGGASELQRDIIATRGMGLPRS